MLFADERLEEGKAASGASALGRGGGIGGISGGRRVTRKTPGGSQGSQL